MPGKLWPVNCIITLIMGVITMETPKTKNYTVCEYCKHAVFNSAYTVRCDIDSKQHPCTDTCDKHED